MSGNPSHPIVVLMTAGSLEEAERIASDLVEARLAACVQIMPGIKSVYRWKGEVAREDEILLTAKTTRDRFAELEIAVREIHSYETPEIVSIDITAGSAPYLEWLMREVGEP